MSGQADAIFSGANVHITTTLAVLGGISYPINGITAVFVKQKELSLGVLLFGVIAVVIGLATILESFVFGLICIAVGGMCALGSFHRPYFLMIRTAGGDTQALESTDFSFISNVRAGIEQAVASRG